MKLNFVFGKMSKEKVQIMLPEELVKKIDEDCKKLYLKKSSWFERAVTIYFDKFTEKETTKKKIDLDI